MPWQGETSMVPLYERRSGADHKAGRLEHDLSDKGTVAQYPSKKKQHGW